MGQALYLTGGRQKSRKVDEWHAYERAVILRVAPDQRAVTCPVEYISPPEVCPDADPSILFKAPSLRGDRLFVPTNTEILIYEVPGLRRAGYLSLPCFNDVHHVSVSPAGHLLVVSTGLDIVMETTKEGKVLREWSASGGKIWERFSRETDYRKVQTTKPHASHPNHVWHDGEEIWVSRFKQRDAICLTRPGRRIEFGGAPHDGIIRHDWIYFTTTDGCVYVVDRQRLTVELCVDLNALDDREVSLGWARGIYPVDERRCWIGFSRLRPTRFRENVSWMRHGFKRYYLPTRIALYDLGAKRLLQEIDLEPHGMHAIYGIVAEPAGSMEPREAASMYVEFAAISENVALLDE